MLITLKEVAPYTLILFLFLYSTASLVFVYRFGDALRASNSQDANSLWSEAISLAAKREEDFCPVDVVFTWVNGSDELHAEQFAKYTGKPITKGDFKLRYNEYGMLRFAMRSVEKHMPFARKIHLVTNGQVPSWWNAKNPNAAIVTHQQIFQTLDENGRMVPIEDALPTFNSNAIEVNLHNIPGLSRHFLYMNDDFLLLKPLKVRDVVDVKTKKLQVWLQGKSSPTSRPNFQWHRTIDRTNIILNKWYHPDNLATPHHFPQHVFYPLDRDILQMAAYRWKDEFVNTSKRRHRDSSDLAIPFLGTNMALEEGAASATNKVAGALLYWQNNHTLNQRTWEFIQKFRGKSVCLNDKFKASPPTEPIIKDLEKKLCSLYPERSAFEDPNAPNPCDQYTNKNDPSAHSTL